MPKSNLDVDMEIFTQAAQPYGEQVFPSLENRNIARRFMVANSWIEPGKTPDVSVYTAALGELLRQGTQLSRQKTAEEIATEAQAAADLEARKKFGVMFSREDDEVRPSRKLADEIFNVDNDPMKKHNDYVDRRLNRARPEEEYRDALEARMKVPAADCPGLKDENETVYAGMNSRISHYQTQIVRQKNREHNQRVRAEYAQRQAAEAEAKSNTKKGL